MKTTFVVLLALMLMACGGGDIPGYTRYYFEHSTSSSSKAVYGPYPSLGECATARSRFPSFYTSGCYS